MNRRQFLRRVPLGLLALPLLDQKRLHVKRKLEQRSPTKDRDPLIHVADHNEIHRLLNEIIEVL